MKAVSAKTLADILSQQDLARVCRSSDIVGSIAIIRLKEASEECKQRIVKAIMSLHKDVNTVLAQTGSVEGDFD